MNNRFVYKLFILLLMVSTLTCNLVMLSFLQRFFYGDLKVEHPETLHRLVADIGSGTMSYRDYKAIKEGSNQFDQLATGWVRWGQPVYFGNEVLWSETCWVTPSIYAISGKGGLVAGRLMIGICFLAA
jgi:putative ABC transport system permease protein